MQQILWSLGLAVLLAGTQPLWGQQPAPDTVLEEADHDHAIEDEIALIKKARGIMYQSRARIESVTRLTPAEIREESQVGAYDGYRVRLLLLDGPLQGQETVTIHYLYEEDRFPETWKTGNKVLIGYLLDEQGQIFAPAIYSRDRSLPLVLLMVLFLGAVMALGRRQGFLSLVALVVTGGLVFLVYIPLVINGAPPLLLAIAVSVLASLLTFLIISGWSFKTLSSSLGVLLGFLVSAVLVLVFGRWMDISGVMNSNIVSLGYTTDLPLLQILFSGILIGAIGAVMDVAISMSSTVQELRRANPRYTGWELFTSALNVGRDLLGTMVNTLIMAYVGSSLPFILLIFLQYSGNSPLLNILNLEVISVEILRSLIGSLGMIATIPTTALVASFLKPAASGVKKTGRQDRTKKARSK